MRFAGRLWAQCSDNESISMTYVTLTSSLRVLHIRTTTVRFTLTVYAGLGRDKGITCFVSRLRALSIELSQSPPSLLTPRCEEISRSSAATTSAQDCQGHCLGLVALATCDWRDMQGRGHFRDGRKKCFPEPTTVIASVNAGQVGVGGGNSDLRRPTMDVNGTAEIILVVGSQPDWIEQNVIKEVV
jgi:hypothetical protein